jgi:hypothetical protein
MITLQQIKDFASREEHAISEDIKAFVAKIEAEWQHLMAASHMRPAEPAMESAKAPLVGEPTPKVLTEGDAAADLAGEPRPDNPSAPAPETPAPEVPAATPAPVPSEPSAG